MTPVRVWALPPLSNPRTASLHLIARLLSTVTHPAALVIDLNPTINRISVISALRRRSLAIVATTTDARRLATAVHLSAPLGPQPLAHVNVCPAPQLPDWLAARPAAAAVILIDAEPPPHQPHRLINAAAFALTPHGHLLIRGSLDQPQARPAPLVTAARTAGLDYTAHLIAATPTRPTGATRPHAPIVHADGYLFQRPGTHPPSPAR